MAESEISVENMSVLKPTRFKIDVEDLFESMKKIANTSFDMTEIKKIVESIISVLEEHNLTFDQAYKILRIVDNTLDTKSKCLKI